MIKKTAARLSELRWPLNQEGRKYEFAYENEIIFTGRGKDISGRRATDGSSLATGLWESCAYTGLGTQVDTICPAFGDASNGRD